MCILQELEFCAHVRVDLAAENDFFENRAGPDHLWHLVIKNFEPAEHDLSPALQLENDTTALVAFPRQMRPNSGSNGPLRVNGPCGRISYDDAFRLLNLRRN